MTKISVKDGNKATFKPVVVDGLGGLVHMITNNDYSLCTYSKDHRSEENFEGAHFIGLDFDDGMTLEQAKVEFSQYEHIIATTRSHQKPKNGKVCDRFRVILSTDSFIDNKDDYRATVLSLLDIYPQADGQCKDAARFFFASKDVVSKNIGGKKFPVTKYVPPPKVEKVNVDSSLRGELSKKTLDFISFGAKSSTWNHRLHLAATDLHEQGYTQQEATNLLQKATIGFDGELDSSDLKTIDSAFSRDPKYSPRGSEDMIEFEHPLKLKTSSSDIEWLVDGVLQSSAMSLMAGSPKSGKSTLTRQLAMAVARGGVFLGRKVKKGKVLYLAIEENEAMITEQFKKLGITDEDEILLKVGPVFGEHPEQRLERSIKAYNADLVVVDTMLLLTGINDINSYNQVYSALNPYRDMTRETGAHIIMIHHKNKGDSTRASAAAGSTALSAAVDCTFVLNETNNPEYRFVNTSQRGGVPFRDQKIKYLPELDIYEIDNSIFVGDF